MSSSDAKGSTIEPGSPPQTVDSGDPVFDRLSIDDQTLTVQVRDVGSGTPLSGRLRDHFLKHNASKVRSWLKLEADRRNQRMERMRSGPELVPPPTASCLPAAAISAVRRGFGRLPAYSVVRRLLGRRLSDRDLVTAADYRRRRGAALEAHRVLRPPDDGSATVAAAKAGMPLVDDLSAALAQVAGSGALEFAVDAAESATQAGTLLVTVEMSKIECLPCSRLSIVPGQLRLSRRAIAEAEVRAALRSWTLLAMGVCLDHLFLDRDDCDAVQILVRGRAASDRSPWMAADATMDKGDFLLDLGCGAALNGAGPLLPRIRLYDIPVPVIRQLLAA